MKFGRVPAVRKTFKAFVPAGEKRSTALAAVGFFHIIPELFP
jgi:hypothetical protein